MENQAIYYYLSPEGANVGPLTLTQLKNLHQDGTITDSTYVISTIEKNGSHLRNCLLPFRRMSPLPFQNPRKQLLPLLRQTLCSLFGKALRTDLNGSFNSIAKSVHGWPKL